ncbi:glycosyltransferase family 25 protein [Devosia sp. ZB163]|uniref:glycosyltransferase family 25 protein n=1 Tax=Devosia sp. ZB163 TaxID=3025938 RepID=UPI0023600C53|nr:glycosyltransferase family 25 protein [Devosia sp. ZB163]MDC9825681.1 glycosyltransferase family 25 protein [Devosia sp. ZB163]
MREVDTLVIHLERATDRAANVTALSEACGGKLTVVDAVDGRQMSQQERSHYQPRFLSPAYPFRLNDGEIGCFLSHRRAWSIIANGSVPFGIVFEDDVVNVSGEFAAHAAWLASVASPDSYVRLLKKQTRAEPGDVIAQQGSWTLSKPRRVGLRAAAQLVGREAAQRLLEWTEVFDRPVDTALQMAWLHKVPMLVAGPSLFETMGASTVSRRRLSVAQRLHREIARPLYRLKVAALS